VSAYAVNKLCRLALHDPGFRERLRSSAEQTVAEFPGLTVEERQALLAGEVGRLHALGAHSFLLGYLPRLRLLGLTQAVYAERMRRSATS
jgi:hypothetical protein